MIPIHNLSNLVEAQIIEAALKIAGVKYVIRKFEDSAYDGIFVTQKGYAQLLVDKEDAQKAKQIIEDLSQSNN